MSEPKEKSVMFKNEDIFYHSLNERIELDKELSTKSDELLVEDLFYAGEKEQLPDELISLLNKYLLTNRLMPKQRAKLEAYFKLIYSNEMWSE